MLSLDDPKTPFVKSWPVQVHALGLGVGCFQYAGFQYAPQLVPWLRENSRHFDALVVNGIWRYHAVGIWRGLSGSGVPYFVIPHSQLNPWFARSFPLKHLKKWLIWRAVQWKVLRDAKAVFFTCEQERRLARNSFNPYVCNEDVVSLAGSDIPEVDRNSARQSLTSAYPEVTGKRIVLFVGRLHPMKGCDLLIRAFANVCGEHRDLHLVIAGPGDDAYARKLRQMTSSPALSGRVTWAGEVTDAMKWAALQTCDVFALASHCEATPLAVVEALGCGVPALITDQVNIWKEIFDAGAGIVGTDNVEGTIESLRTWLALPQREADAMRANARNCFLNYFDSRSNASLFVEGLMRHGVA
jgi:glycosyltransferase involved in cell wall biosynthesis